MVEGENDGEHEERPIDEMVREFETDLRCRMVTTRRSEEGLVVMVENGTCTQVVSVEYRGQDTNTQEEGGNFKHFIDVWLRNSILVDRMRGQEMVAYITGPSLERLLLGMQGNYEDIPDSLEESG